MIVGFFIFLLITLIVVLIIYESCNISAHKDETDKITPYELTATAKVTATFEETYTNVAPKYIRIASDANCYEAISNGIGFVNYRTYKFTAKFIETNRFRTRQIETLEPTNILEEISSLGYYKDSITYEPISPEAATENQLQYIGALIEETSCNVEIPLNKLSKADASGIIYYLTDGGHTPSKDIIEYATELHIRASYCFPDWLIFGNIFENLSAKEKIAFFIFCVFRDKYKPTCENPNHSPYKNLFTSFADLYCENKKFLDSFHNHYYNGHNLVRFGKTITREFPVRGGSKQTLAYKTAIEYLENHLEASEIQPFRL